MVTALVVAGVACLFIGFIVLNIGLHVAIAAISEPGVQGICYGAYAIALGILSLNVALYMDRRAKR